MKKALILALLRLGFEKGIQSKSRPKVLGLKIAAGIFMFLSTIFLLITCHQLLTYYYNSIIANLVFTLVFIAFGIIALIIANKKQQTKKQLSSSEPLANLQENLQEMAQPFIDSAQYAGEKARVGFNQNQGKIIIGVLLASMLYGRYKANNFIKNNRD